MRQCGCGAPIAAKSTSGRCRSCATAARFADPEWRARQHASLKAAMADPALRDRRSAAAKARYQDPAERQKIGDGKRRAFAADPAKLAAAQARGASVLRNWHATTDRDWTAWHQERARRQREERQAAAEARAAAKVEAARLAALSPFERQLERVRAGAGLSYRIPMPSRVHTVTLGGVAPEAM